VIAQPTLSANTVQMLSSGEDSLLDERSKSHAKAALFYADAQAQRLQLRRA